MITHRVGRNVEFVGDFGRGQSAQDEPRYLALALGQALRIDDQRRNLRRPCLLEDDGNLSLGVCTSKREATATVLRRVLGTRSGGMYPPCSSASKRVATA